MKKLTLYDFPFLPTIWNGSRCRIHSYLRTIFKNILYSSNHLAQRRVQRNFQPLHLNIINQQLLPWAWRRSLSEGRTHLNKCLCQQQCQKNMDMDIILTETLLSKRQINQFTSQHSPSIGTKDCSKKEEESLDLNKTLTSDYETISYQTLYSRANNITYSPSISQHQGFQCPPDILLSSA